MFYNVKSDAKTCQRVLVSLFKVMAYSKASRSLLPSSFLVLPASFPPHHFFHPYPLPSPSFLSSLSLPAFPLLLSFTLLLSISGVLSVISLLLSKKNATSLPPSLYPSFLPPLPSLLPPSLPSDSQTNSLIILSFPGCC